MFCNLLYMLLEKSFPFKVLFLENNFIKDTCIWFFFKVWPNIIFIHLRTLLGFPCGSTGMQIQESTCNAGDLGSIPELGRSPGEESGSPLQYYCLENSMDRGAWEATVHVVAKSWTQLSNWACRHTMYINIILHDNASSISLYEFTNWWTFNYFYFYCLWMMLL